MARKRNRHYPQLSSLLDQYAESRGLDYNRYSEYHMRICDGGYTMIDVWTTGRYWVFTTDYFETCPELKIPERTNEKGLIPVDKLELTKFLDKLFFGTENLNGRR